MAALQSFLLSCFSSAANIGPSAVEATHAGSVALHDTAERSAEAVTHTSHLHAGFTSSASVWGYVQLLEPQGLCSSFNY